MQTVRTALTVLACLLVLGGCGNKGPLYLPDKSPETETAKEQKDSTEEASKDAEKDGARRPGA